MSEKPIIILGAGATKACGGPLTDEILPAALNGEMEHDDQKTSLADREELLYFTSQFLTDCFNVPMTRPVTKVDCPSLPMVLSMLRRSIDLKQPIGNWEGERLVKAKRAIEYSIFAVIEAALRRMSSSARFLHEQLLEPLYERGADVTVASLNYDVIVDNAMFSLCEAKQNMRPPDYGVDIATERYANFTAHGTFGRLLKIHGSLNWLYCEKCKRLDLFVSRGNAHGQSIGRIVSLGPIRRCVQLSRDAVPQSSTMRWFRQSDSHLADVRQGLRESSHQACVGPSRECDEAMRPRRVYRLQPAHRRCRSGDVAQARAESFAAQSNHSCRIRLRRYRQTKRSACATRTTSNRSAPFVRFLAQDSIGIRLVSRAGLMNRK